MNGFSKDIALELIKLIIESGHFKPIGPCCGTINERNAEFDAQYLKILFEKLTIDHASKS